MCIERMKQCDDIVALAKELNIHRRLLYCWRDQLVPAEKNEWPPPQIKAVGWSKKFCHAVVT